MPVIPCFLCGKELELRTDKNQKLYFICDPCGAQTFIRRKKGIEHLREFLRNVEKAKIPFRQCATNLHEVQAILQEIDGVRLEIKKTESFFANKEQVRARKLLKTRLANLFEQLEELAKRKA